jgi:hypothetical protein
MTRLWKISTIALALWTVASNGAIRSALAEQGNMDDAITKLQDARGALQRAANDKGGHRTKAIALVNEAIEEAKAGVEHASHR